MNKNSFTSSSLLVFKKNLCLMSLKVNYGPGDNLQWKNSKKSHIWVEEQQWGTFQYACLSMKQHIFH
jgi:hypothetical protein